MFADACAFGAAENAKKTATKTITKINTQAPIGELCMPAVDAKMASVAKRENRVGAGTEACAEIRNGRACTIA